MADLISGAQWAAFEDLINSAHDTFNQEIIIWRRYLGGMSLHGEDKPVVSSDIDLKVLINYNYFKVWSTNKPTETGEMDQVNQVLYINLKYLQDNGWLTPSGIFIFNQDKDRFIHRSIVYKSTGFTPISQARSKPLLLQVNLSREDTPTGASHH